MPIEQQRIFSDWKEATKDELTLQEAGITKKSKILIFEKKEIIDTPENKIIIPVEYNDIKEELEMNANHYFMDLISQFFKVLITIVFFHVKIHPFPERVDDIKLKQKSKNVKVDQLISELQNYQQNPIRIIITDKSVYYFNIYHHSRLRSKRERKQIPLLQ